MGAGIDFGKKRFYFIYTNCPRKQLCFLPLFTDGVKSLDVRFPGLLSVRLADIQVVPRNRAPYPFRQKYYDLKILMELSRLP